ncbi:MAG: hypothetical protein ACTSVC_07210, partial [Promethearchaeota archaeon]
SLIGKNKDLILVNTDSFNKIKPKLIDFLKKNYIVVIMVDFSNSKQLRIPFYLPPWDFLIPSPLSAASLHFNSGAPIITAIIHPKRLSFISSKLVVKFLDSLYFLEDLNNNPNNDKIYDEDLEKKKKLYGRIMYNINLKTNRFLLKFPFYWEELLGLTSGKIDYIIHFKEDLDILELFTFIKKELDIFFEKTYVPYFHDENKDKFILEELDKIIKEIGLSSHDNDNKDKLKLKNKKITLHGLSIYESLNLIFKKLALFLAKSGVSYQKYARMLRDLNSNIKLSIIKK